MTEPIPRSDCEHVVRQLWSYLDGQIAADHRETVERHLTTCVQCASHYDFARQFLATMSAARPHLATNASTADRVERLLEERGFRRG